MIKIKKDFVLIFLISAVIVVSGCINGGSGQDEVDEGVTAIDVVELEVTPNEIFSGGSIDASLTLENTGNANATLITDRGAEDPLGTAVLESYCPDLFRIESFRAESDTVEATQHEYQLQPGEQLSMIWNLRQFDEERIRFYDGDSCQLDFAAPFEYSVEAFQQLQIRDNDDLEAPNLETRSSRGPMLLSITTIGSTSQFNEPYFIEEDFHRDHEVRAEIEMINQIPEGGEHGIVDAEPPEIELIGGSLEESISLDEEITVPENGEEEEVERCGIPSGIYLYGGDSTIIGCDLNLYDDEHYSNGEVNLLTGRTSITEIRARADYEYNAPMGSRTVEVQFRGDN